MSDKHICGQETIPLTDGFEDRHMSSERGMDRHIAKPFDINELIGTANRISGSCPGQNAPGCFFAPEFLL